MPIGPPVKDTQLVITEVIRAQLAMVTTKNWSLWTLRLMLPTSQAAIALTNIENGSETHIVTPK
jgi:hypothetical protein